MTADRTFEWSQGAEMTFARCSPSAEAVALWYEELAQFVQFVASNSDRIEIVDNGFGQYPEVFVNGVEGSFDGRRFQVSSDLPGELILIHGELRAGQVEQLCNTILHYWIMAGRDT